MKILTISVAAYNVEKYLSQLIDSIVSSGVIDDIELLIVNDGSTDKTAEIAKEYSLKYPDSIKLINKMNGGHGSTINTGIENASGVYFRALDGDDWLNSEGLNRIVSYLKEVNYDLVLTNYSKCYSDGTEIDERFDNLVNGMVYSIKDINNTIQWMRYHTVIFNTKILQEYSIRLDENCFYVDSEFMILPIPYIDSIVYYDICLYCYRLGVQGQSVSPESRRKHSNDSYIVTKRLLTFYSGLSNDLDESKKRYIEYGIAGHCIWHFRTIMSFSARKYRKKQLIDYDQMIYDCSPNIYNEMENYGRNSKFIVIIRRSKYMLYYCVAMYKKIKQKMINR